MKITPLSFQQYNNLTAIGWHTALSDYYMNLIQNGGGRAYSLTDGINFFSYCILLSENDGSVIEYIHTGDGFRNQGYSEELIRRVIREENKNSYFRIHIINSHPYYDAVISCAKRLGFTITDTSKVYSVSVSEKLWSWVDNLKLTQKKSYILDKGSQCVSFRYLTENIRRQLIQSDISDFENSLSPEPFFTNSKKMLVEDMSFALIRAGRLRAYTLLTRNHPENVCVEQIAESRSEIGGGSIIAPLCASIEVVRKTPEIRKINMMIRDHNDRSNRFVSHFLINQDVRVVRNIEMKFINNVPVGQRIQANRRLELERGV